MLKRTKENETYIDWGDNDDLCTWRKKGKSTYWIDPDYRCKPSEYKKKKKVGKRIFGVTKKKRKKKYTHLTI